MLLVVEVPVEMEVVCVDVDMDVASMWTVAEVKESGWRKMLQ